MSGVTIGGKRAAINGERRYVLVVNDASRTHGETVTVSTDPERVAWEVRREFGDELNGPSSFADALRDVLLNSECGVRYSIPVGNVWAVMFDTEHVPDIDHLAFSLSSSVPKIPGDRTSLGR